jgi:hypothetical protein
MQAKAPIHINKQVWEDSAMMLRDIQRGADSRQAEAEAEEVVRRGAQVGLGLGLAGCRGASEPRRGQAIDNGQQVQQLPAAPMGAAGAHTAAPEALPAGPPAVHPAVPAVQELVRLAQEMDAADEALSPAVIMTTPRRVA